MEYTQHDRTLALAGLFQACRLVQQVARTGLIDQELFEASVKSIFKIDADSPEDVYGGARNVLYGCKTILSQLGAGSTERAGIKPRDTEITKYVIAIMVLERKLAKRKDLMQKIGVGVERAAAQAEHFGHCHDNVIANLADTYSETVSTLRPRIMVSGEHQHISNPGNANKIRALLLAAMRSAVLWRQCGGTRWQLLLNRKMFLSEAEQIINEVNKVLH